MSVTLFGISYELIVLLILPLPRENRKIRYCDSETGLRHRTLFRPTCVGLRILMMFLQEIGMFRKIYRMPETLSCKRGIRPARVVYHKCGVRFFENRLRGDEAGCTNRSCYMELAERRCARVGVCR